MAKESLILKRKNLEAELSEKEKTAARKFCEGYKRFLDACKTERESVEVITAMLEKAGYTPYDPALSYKAGAKVYQNNRGKALIAATLGRRPVADGVRICASHIDCPRLDLKPYPLYEDFDLAFFKTHYYGGIKKYQWTAMPLSLHGVVVKRDGSSVTIRLGDDDGDPVLCVTDLLPHLAQEQMKKKLDDGITGEQLNVLVGCALAQDTEEKERVKLRVLELLNKAYGISEEDFLSAELCVTPAGRARDVGFDRDMIGAYGQDDRVCAYTALMAELAAKSPEYTTVTCFADKEETGSDGNTGLSSFFLVDFIEDLAEAQGAALRHVLAKSKCLSADVSAAVDPTYIDAHEKRNNTYLGGGVAITKYTGARGKYSTNDASAETMGFFRAMLDKKGIIWQTGEMGKVDVGGGGTVAKYVSAHNIDTVDIGVALLSMHSPFEISSKLDVYMLYRTVEAFFE